MWADIPYRRISRAKRPKLTGTEECWVVSKVWEKECFAAVMWLVCGLFVCHRIWHPSSQKSSVCVIFWKLHSICWQGCIVQAVHDVCGHCLILKIELGPCGVDEIWRHSWPRHGKHSPSLILILFFLSSKVVFYLIFDVVIVELVHHSRNVLCNKK